MEEIKEREEIRNHRLVLSLLETVGSSLEASL
jgi:hypothetical protein